MAGKYFSPSFTNGQITRNALEVLIASKRCFPNPKREFLFPAHSQILLKVNTRQALSLWHLLHQRQLWNSIKAVLISLQTENKVHKCRLRRAYFILAQAHKPQFRPEPGHARPFYRRIQGPNYLHFVLIARSPLKNCSYCRCWAIPGSIQKQLWL